MSSVLGTPFDTVAEAYNRNADKYDEFIENNPNLIRIWHACLIIYSASLALNIVCDPLPWLD